MNILRHYDKELAVVLSVFGSSDESAIATYKGFFYDVKENLPENALLRMSMSSRTVLKKLEAKNEYYLTLPEQLANLDRLGYKKVVIASINAFPTEEHENILKITKAYEKYISYSKYQVTNPLFTNAKVTNKYLENLNNSLRSKYNCKYLLFIAHGYKHINTLGYQSFMYVRDYLKLLHPANFLYSIEGGYPYHTSAIIKDISANTPDSINDETILLVPLLLVAGNHFKNDINSILLNLKDHFKEILLPNDFQNNGDFCLLNLIETKSLFIENIDNAITMLNW